MKRRALVLTDESAGHPFRRSLPPHVRRVETEEEGKASPAWRLTGCDWRDFLGAYCASFVAVTAFIS